MPQVSPDSFEFGQSELGVSFREQVIIEYYATEGSFVVHDDRGGGSWATRQVHVQ